MRRTLERALARLSVARGAASALAARAAHELRPAAAELLDALAPEACALCGAASDAAGECPLHPLPPPITGTRGVRAPLCPCCARALPPSLATAERCAACRREPPPFAGALALGAWRDEAGLRAFVLALKHGRRADLARPLGQRLAALLAEGGPPAADAVLVPVPLSTWRRLERGHDQALGLARALAESLDLPLVQALARARHGPPQGSVLGRSRAANVRGAFRLRRFAARRVSGRELWLVDDVATSGATAAECARLLRRAGARSVRLALLARAGAERGEDEDRAGGERDRSAGG